MKKNKAIDKFLNKDLTDDEKIQLQKKKHLKESNGLIERVDKIFVTKDGKQLLREQY